MPQMAPLNWTTLLILFNLTLITFMIMTFFNYKIINQSLNLNKSTKKIKTWLW
uniref:ATP synthase complex subunit 8 n=1 Tax=Priacma serrata TaxID=50550 RepID=A0A0S2MQT7_PRISE|nr:ATP synthase F0 subunit 8 [Priacma serrata]